MPVVYWEVHDGEEPPKAIEAVAILLMEAKRASEPVDDEELTDLIETALIRAARIGAGAVPGA